MSVLSGGMASYTYGNASHKHAVTALSTGESYTYDANGNITQRIEGGLTYTQTFDAENRLVSVTVSGQTTQFVYDGDGNLVKKVKPDGSWTIYVGKVYEVDKTSGGVVTRTLSYYRVAGAMRIGGTLYYVLTDQLGSASVVTDNTGTVVGEQRYYPYGETRAASGNMQTDRLFTGQQQMASLGNIYEYGARFYSPLLGRFLGGDTIVPDPARPQSLDRYAFVLNNPIRYTDPTGHDCCDHINFNNQEGCDAGEWRTASRLHRDAIDKTPAGLRRETASLAVTRYGVPLRLLCQCDVRKGLRGGGAHSNSVARGGGKASRKWKMENGRRRMENRKWGMGNRKGENGIS